MQLWIVKRFTAGRQAYLILHLIDYMFITQFYTLLAFALALLVRRIKKIKMVLAIPLIAGVFNILENLSIDASILMYPVKVQLIGTLSGYFTLLKFIMLYSALLVNIALRILSIRHTTEKVS